MRKLKSLLTLGLVSAGLWFFFQHFDVEGLEQVAVKPVGDSPDTAASSPDAQAPPVVRSGETVRIASFNIQVFGESKAGKPHVMDVLTDIVRRFDVVAIQEIRAKNQDVLPNFVEQLNATGRKYDYVIGPRLGRTSSKEQYAYVYDTQSIEVDRTSVYTVEDPDDLLHRPPLVAAFRVRGPPPDQAFTFTLINIHTDPDETDTELDFLDDVYMAVRNDGRGEDDILLLGDLNVDDRHLGQLGNLSNIAWVVSDMPTNTRGNKLYDNLVYHSPSTTEFTGRWGVFDIMREYNLTLDQALEVSDHLPIWAEMSIYEGGRPGRIAREGTTTTR